jgi:hypothetical protein
LAIDPMNSDVVFAATSTGVFKTGSGGQGWSDPSNGALDGVNLHSLAIDPLKPSSVYAGTANGILGTTDGGSTWSNRLTAKAIYNLVFASQHTVHAADFADISYYPARRRRYEHGRRSHMEYRRARLYDDPGNPRR